MAQKPARLYGDDAIRYAVEHGVNLSHRPYPCDQPSSTLTPEEAGDVALVDPDRVWIDSKAAARALRAIPSEKRSEASRQNGRKGGRPRKTPKRNA